MWSQPLRSLAGGILWADNDTDFEALLADLDDRWITAHCLIPADASKESLIAQIGEQLGFPDWAGSNLDALYDLLTDLSWLDEDRHLALILDRGPSSPSVVIDGWQQIVQVLIDATTYWLPKPRIVITALR